VAANGGIRFASLAHCGGGEGNRAGPDAQVERWRLLDGDALGGQLRRGELNDQLAAALTAARSVTRAGMLANGVSGPAT
jgi:hypothetical protein